MHVMRASARNYKGMASPKTIMINGRAYDSVTGLPVETPKTTSKAAPAPKQAAKAAPAKASSAASSAAATSVHSTVQRATTLARRVAKKPATPQRIARRPQAGRHMDIAQSPNVKKFAPHPVVKEATPKKADVKPDAPAQVHPAAARALAKAERKKQAQQKAVQPQTAKQAKDLAIAKALDTPKQKEKKDKKEPKSKWTKRLIIIGIILVVILGALYAVYRFIPAVSVGIAANQAGIDAKYPNYVPDGFSLRQPVTYTDGEVNLKFASNSNSSSYTISQKRSSWDSSAVLDNVVQPLVSDNYTTTQERGLTIYTYDKGAAWVNGNILYVISGDASLSNDQVRHIATSF